MKLGLIGNPLDHSWSPEIHRYLAGADYELWPLAEDELDMFFSEKDFDGINVTIPYKSSVLKYLDDIDDTALSVGATNTVINRGGKLKGYNTDVTGLLRIIENHEIDAAGGTCAILGSGGASKAAAEVCRRKGWHYVIVSRSPGGGAISYEELRDMKDRITVLINATPVGMNPHEDEMPEDPSDFAGLKYLIDIVANPIRTTLSYEAELIGVRAFGGFEMLVAQALAADELFFEKKMDDSLTGNCMETLLRSRRNLVLIGMPSSGKTTVGEKLSEITGRKFIDIDREIVRIIGMPIAEFFSRNGEDAFRDLESEVCRNASAEQGLIIATGGGVIKRRENMRSLAHRGLIIWLDRDVDLLQPTDSRPLSADTDALKRLYEERMHLYELYSDIRIDNNRGPGEAAETICRLAGITG